jgi:uncharacterized protein (DUF362 family)
LGEILSKSVVSITNDENVFKSVSEALSYLNINKQLKPNFNVLIKANFVRAPSNAPYTYEQGAYERCWTDEGDIIHRDVLEGILRVLTQNGISKIYIGDAAGGCETPIVFENLDLYNLASQYNATLIDLNYADSVKVPVENGYLIKELWVPKIIREVDYRISLTTYKIVHDASIVSLGLKNWGIGLPPGGYYGFNKGTAEHKKGIVDPLPIHRQSTSKGEDTSVAQVIADVCSTQKFEFSIIDALTVVHRSPNLKYVADKFGLIIAGNDPVATDTVAATIGGLDPKNILHIKLCAQKKLGTNDLSRIEVKGLQVNQVQRTFVPSVIEVKDVD